MLYSHGWVITQSNGRRVLHIDGLVQDRRNSSALAMEVRLSCTNPSIYLVILKWQVEHRLDSQQTPHTSPSWESYGVFIESILEKIDCVVIEPHCISWMRESDRLVLQASLTLLHPKPTKIMVFSVVQINGTHQKKPFSPMLKIKCPPQETLQHLPLSLSSPPSKA